MSLQHMESINQWPMSGPPPSLPSVAYPYKSITVTMTVTWSRAGLDTRKGANVAHGAIQA